MKPGDIIFYIALCGVTFFTAWHAAKGMFATCFDGMAHAWWASLGLLALIGLLLGRYL